MRLLHGLFAAFAALSFSSAAIAFDRGPGLGAQIPAGLEAQDQNNQTQNFETLKGERGLVLAFTRSADWCPFCQRQLIGLEGVRADIEARGWALAAITTDDTANLARFAERRHIGFPLLSDADFSIIDAFDLRDPAYPPGNRRHGLPVPSIWFIDGAGIISAKLGDDDYRIRPAPEQVLAIIDALGN
jgi:peroxiredoxin